MAEITRTWFAVVLLVGVSQLLQASELDFDNLFKLKKYIETNAFEFDSDFNNFMAMMTSPSYTDALVENATITPMVNDLEEALTQASWTLDRLHQRLRPYILQFTEETERIYAFQARLSAPQAHVPETTLLFDTTEENYGWSYNIDTGEFEVMQNGPHMFVVTVTTKDWDPINLELMRNDVPVGYIDGGGQTVSNSFILDLLSGDRVKVVIQSTGSDIDDGFNTVFVGFTI